MRTERFKRVTGEECRWTSLDRRWADVRDKKREDGKTKQAVEWARSTGLPVDCDFATHGSGSGNLDKPQASILADPIIPI